MYLVYILKSDNYSYVGMTNDFFHRFRQHNREIKGGAKYTSKRDNWYPVCIIDGFTDKKSACQCEWRVKRGKKGPSGRIKYLSDYLNNNEFWTSKSNSLKNQNLTFYIDNEFKNLFNHDSKELYWKN